MEYFEGNILLRFLTNQCSHEEKEELNFWLNESEQNRSTLNYLKGQLNLQKI